MKITKKMWEHGGRRYIEIDHITFKVPWRYNRVLGLEINGTTFPIQMIPVDTLVQSFKFKTVVWEDTEYKVLTSITFMNDF